MENNNFRTVKCLGFIYSENCWGWDKEMTMFGTKRNIRIKTRRDKNQDKTKLGQENTIDLDKKKFKVMTRK